MKKFVFGPVNSRRLGISLGIDIVPKKVCNLNCIYCEVGPTTSKIKNRAYYTSWEDIKEEFISALKEFTFDVVTITGSGEPTLNLHIANIVHEIKKITDKPLVLLTNSLLFTSPEVRNEVQEFNIIVPSLDAALPKDFLKIDRPVYPVEPADIIHGLSLLRKEFLGQIWLEVLLCKNINDSPEAIQALHKAINKIKPDKIQLHTVNRPPITAIEEGHILLDLALNNEDLQKVKVDLNVNFEVEVIRPHPQLPLKSDNATQPINGKGQNAQIFEHTQERILEHLKRRPASINDLTIGLNIDKTLLLKHILALQKNNIIKPINYNNREMFTLI